MATSTETASLERRPEMSVRPMTNADLRAVVDVHFEVFPDYFLTQMGRSFTRLYYAQYLTFDRAYALVADVDGSVGGFIVGGRDVGDLERRFYRRHFLTLASIVAYRFVTDRAARSSIMARAWLVRTATRTVLRPKKAAAADAAKLAKKPRQRPTASILAAAVYKRHQGIGAGKALLDRFVDLARADGVHVVRGTSRGDNVDQIARKVRGGWRQVRADERRATFELDLVPAPSEVQEVGRKDD